MSGKYQAYPEYTSYPEAWIGQIPSGWSVTRLKFTARINMGQSPSSEDCNDEGVGKPFLQGNAEFTTLHPVAKQYCPVAKKYALPGDLLFSVRAPVGALNEADQEYGIGRGLCAITPMELVGSFMWWVLQTAKQQLNSVSTGSTFESVSAEQVENLSIVLPSTAEQRTIAAFLDHETARIDRLIEKQQRLIELLKEKRQAVISHAVTKGLDPNVPMKDSGVEWLGQVPEHWVVKRLKHISPRIGVGLVINPSHYVQDEGVYFLFGGDVVEYGFRLTKTRKMSNENSLKLLQSRLKENDLVCVRVGYPGVTAVIPKELEGCNCASMMVIRRGSFDSSWLAYCMNSEIGKKQVELVQYGAAQKQFNIADAIEFRFPVPPKAEQTELTAFLDEQRAKFNKLIGKGTEAISLLQERRTALISAAVTGKIDVRNWSPNQQTTEPELLMAAENSAEYHVS